MDLKRTALLGLITAGTLFCLYPFPFMSAGLALILGFGIGFFLSDDDKDKSMKIAKKALALSIVMLGAKIDFMRLLDMSTYNLIVTFLSIVLILVVSYGFTRLFRLSLKTGLLIGVGTAICGGSAIAAAAPVLMAEKEDIGLSMAVVFILNAIALFLFPVIGTMLNMDQEAFGFWAALAIHDTSSVVGAALDYGDIALEHATILKLTRALWIGPMVIALSLIYPYLNEKSDSGKTKLRKISFKLPWFIVGFVCVSLIFSFINFPDIANLFAIAGERGLVFALFLIGLAMNITTLKKAGAKSLTMGVLLWVLVSSVSLVLIYEGVL